MTPGIHDVDAATYHRFRAASASGLRVIHAGTPAHLRRSWDEQDKPSLALVMGTLIHQLVLEPQTPLPRIALVPETYVIPDDAKPAKGAKAKAERAPPKAPPEPKEPQVDLTDDQRLYVEILEKLSGRLKANIVGPKGDVLQELDVKDLTSTLKGFRKKVKAVVFDGVITQRLLDIAVEKDVPDIVGKKMGNVTKQPDKVNVWTLDDLS